MNLNGPDIGPYRNKTQNYEKKSNRRVTIRFYLYERFVKLFNLIYEYHK